jgi:hypothetical protein
MIRFLLVGLGSEQQFPLQRGLNRLGRNPTNDFRVTDASVSSFHCEISVGDDAVQIRDLNSTNGTYLDGKKVSEAEIRAGQVLKLGSAEFRLEEESVTVAIPQVSVDHGPKPAFLPDGSPACLNHTSEAAVWRCMKCGNTYCPSCVRVLGLAGGHRTVFCTSCTGTCEPLVVAAPNGKQSFLGRLTQTLKLTFGR